MIKVIDRGEYSIDISIEGKVTFFMINMDSPNKKTAYTLNNPQNFDLIPPRGMYRIYHVEKESQYSNGIHVEILLAMGKWQGYLSSESCVLVPIAELITK